MTPRTRASHDRREERMAEHRDQRRAERADARKHSDEEEPAPFDTLGDVATYLRGSGLTLHLRYQGSIFVAWLTGDHGETRAIGSAPIVEHALAKCVDEYESKLTPAPKPAGQAKAARSKRA